MKRVCPLDACCFLHFSVNLYVFIAILCCFLLYSCKRDPAAAEKKYRIAFSQCTSDDNWRRRMLADMKREMAFHPGIEFLYRDAKDNSRQQAEQVRDLINQHIDLLMISPNEAQP